MRKRLIVLVVPVIGLFAVFTGSPAHMEGVALGAGGAGGTGNNGGGTKVYASNGDDVQIFVDPVNHTLAASGALGTARSEPFPPSATQAKEIGCWVDAAQWASMVTCQATTNNGSILRCSAFMTAPATPDIQEPWGNGLAQAMASMNGESFITFTTDLAPGGIGIGDCVSVRIENNSKYYPRVP